MWLYVNLRLVIFKLLLWMDVSSIFCKIAYQELNIKKPHYRLVNIGLGNGLVPSGNKPWIEPTLTKFFDAI